MHIDRKVAVPLGRETVAILEAGRYAGLFADALHGPFRGAFARVCLSIIDWSEDEHFIGPFRRRLG